ncbi:MAG: hypothetical protein CMC31_03295 [Flavobacteriaceae bacterium]|nr:hypothetical protein [Flavobacteriaceae bacterium]
MFFLFIDLYVKNITTNKVNISSKLLIGNEGIIEPLFSGNNKKNTKDKNRKWFKLISFFTTKMIIMTSKSFLIKQ